MTRLTELRAHGQSIWYDNIRRALLDSGELQSLLDAGVMGVTSNPAIFEKAIGGSADYDTAMAALPRGLDPEAVYERLALEDVGRTADLLRPIFDRTNGVDGYVSLEVSPALAHDSEGTVAAGRRLYEALNRANVMIKVPATPAGLPAVVRLIAEGISVNVTLIFDVATYERVAEAYVEGLERRIAAGGDPSRVASVASFFVSRIDTRVDAALDALDRPDLQGRTAIANARVAYARFRRRLETPRWRELAARGATPQRLLWASTGTKSPAYRDTLYVDELIGPLTVNTVPPLTLDHFLHHGTVADTLQGEQDAAVAHLRQVAELGIDFAAISRDLLREGVEGFAAAFDALLDGIRRKRAARASASATPMALWLGAATPVVARAIADLARDGIMRRIWAHDHTVWGADPAEITNRLGWLGAPEMMEGQIPRLTAFAAEVRQAGFTDAVLLGMGGSSLAPEAYATILGPSAPPGSLRLTIIDSTDPDLIRRRTDGLDLTRTLFLVASKSGSTIETLSAFKHFYHRVASAGIDAPGAHFVAITDPGTGLAELARTHRFRGLFLADPCVGGRYSALTAFGLVPAALLGADLALLLDRAATTVCNAASANCPQSGDNRAAQLGVILAELARMGRDKLTITTTAGLESFADWVEQLLAESTGKNGTGIVPVVREPLGRPEVYGSDRLFVDVRLGADNARLTALARLYEAGHPVIILTLADRGDLGGQFFLWEMATAVAGHRLGIHPFDQPNVEAAKVAARRLVDEALRTDTLPPSARVPATPEALRTFLEQGRAGDYVALQAFLDPTPAADAQLSALRVAIRDRHRIATTLGYGPRFLHSTGQLHKGDGGSGLFVQITSEGVADLGIPDDTGPPSSTLGFQMLKAAQAQGDAQALLDAGRRVLQLSVPADPAATLQALLDAVR